MGAVGRLGAEGVIHGPFVGGLQKERVSAVRRRERVNEVEVSGIGGDG
jgi:hypothetical protein